MIWLNPPYSLDVETNVGGEFLKLIDKHFPPNHPLHSICNRSTVKVSYRCMPNFGSVIARHNAKILRKSAPDEFAEGGGTLQKYFWKPKNNGKNQQ